MNGLATITIGMGPNIFDFGSLVLSWHGFMTFVAVAVSVFLVVRAGSRQGMVADSIYSVAVWAIIGGVVGARLLHVIDFWGEIYQDDPLSVFYAWQGGVTIYGAILGGFAGGALYIIIRNSAWYLSMWGRYFRFLGSPNRAPLPGVGHLADLSAPALLLAQAIGRVGDVINGEHCATQTDLPWGIVYTHDASPGLLACGTAPTHPAVAYELLFDLALLAVLWPLRNRLRPRGMFFTLYLACYSIGRFFISFLRVEFNEYFGALNEAQVVALAVMLITIPLLVYRAKLVKLATGNPSS
ncbi:MAG: prolipoprotein diacylglyceryl transferase [Dehalococcoidia bacterium]|jgi:phosphatidylglycerol:prolipoprotein diacylglycerol transferase|nr:prolipoprotein diacylglyceryl transferase [Dehalococcoidia bacterium]MDP6228277.1 prolipoprotein diacylglyceryl transferase [Dehalococcoidia bacterium]MDP7083221.1 prolipoprotein diacylglyceryl transferase [Dehalococcoidia bacterium]MDP7200754.1 prolipoprotein diacylglyceryl transferase [Dehalococcoidia bacterium]MDP7511049.1 prolipoprotein diacylglyceryl transferase [Dehalococcoidia bacterium]